MGTAVVTGASGGIGLELSKILAREGYDLVLVARSGDRLKEIARELGKEYGIKTECLSADLTQADAAEKLFQLTGGKAEILVNNAGFGDYGLFSECDWNKQEKMMELNILALSRITHRFLPSMIENGKGRILNVASVAAFVPGPLMSVYYASKSYVLSFTEALSVELKGTGVTATALCPGPVNTGFSKAANAEDVSLFKQSSGADAADVAEFGYRKMTKGKTVAVHGLLFGIALLFVKTLPRCVVRKLIFRIQKSRIRR